jgi:type I restriction enzyme S subunit
MAKRQADVTGVPRTTKNAMEDAARFGSSGEGGVLPEGWARVRLQDVCALNPSLPVTVAADAKVSFVPMAAVSEFSGAIVDSQTREFREVSKGYTTFTNDDVLWAKITPCMENGKAAIARDLVSNVGCGSTEFFVLRSNGSLLPELLYRFVRQPSYRHAARKTMNSAVGQARVPKGFLLETPFLLPPLAEQRRIVARLEALEARSRRARAALDALPPLLAEARQSVLAAAFRGNLTTDWRNAVQETGPVLPIVTTERRRRWEQAELARIMEKGNAPNDDRWREKYPQPIALDPVEYGESADGREREWACLEEITDAERTICYGVVQLGGEVPDGVPCIRTSDLKPLKLLTGSPKRIRPEVSAEYSRTVLKGGEILVSVRGTLGGIATATEEVRGWNISREVAMVVVVSPVDENYVARMIAAPQSQAWLTRAIKGVAYSGINIADLKQLPVPLAPPAEQRETVRRLDAALARLDAAGAAHAEAVAELDRLDASLLAKAFRGELVLQDPADEPAAITLQRLRTPREVFDPVAYLFQFIPALLHASEGALPFARALEGCALLRVPRDLVHLLEPIGGAPARQHFERFAQPLNDGSFVPVLRKLIAAGAITHDPRAGHTLRLVEAKAPPIAPLIAEDARHVASVLALVPTEALADLTPRQVRKLCPNAAAAALAC